MKRKAESKSSPSTSQPPRRQPQVSCDSCRQRKLKCDRGQPCASCRVRGLLCTTPSQSPPADPYSSIEVPQPDMSTSSISGRLAALEQAVFRAAPLDDCPPTRSNDPHPHRLSVSGLERECCQAAKFLDLTYGGTKSTDLTAKLGFCIAEGHQHSAVAIDSPTDRGIRQQPTRLMPREEALALLHDFVNNAYHLLPIVHTAAVQSLIDNVYSELAPGGTLNIDPSHAALIFSFCATSAFFWNGAEQCQHRFESVQAAVQASFAWRESALQSLEEAQRAQSNTLEGAQAYAILAYLLFNVEGPSARFRLLHMLSVTACRELAIHLVDNHGYDSADNAAIREVKRRLWWHVTATDWMLGLNGGPLDGTYTIHPRHMKVALPRNLNDSDLCLASDALTYPRDIPTHTSCFLLRIQLAEVCRAVVDAHLPDGDTADNEQVLALDQLFDHALANFPHSLTLNTPIPHSAPRFLCLQRATIYLGFHSRRARLHRPFLISKDAGGQPDAKYRDLRSICIQSARTVLDISMSLLEHSLPGLPYQPRRLHILDHPGHQACPCSPVHRLGVVINHLFMACAVLAFNSSLQSNRGVQGKGMDAVADSDLHDTLTHACCLLAAAGEESAVAADVVRGMTEIYTRYRIRGVNSSSAAQKPPAGRCAGKRAKPVGSIGDEARSSSLATFCRQKADTTSADRVEVAGLEHSKTVIEGGSECDVFGLDRVLEDFLEPAYLCDDWDQVIAGLDSYCGAA